MLSSQNLPPAPSSFERPNLFISFRPKEDLGVFAPKAKMENFRAPLNLLNNNSPSKNGSVPSLSFMGVNAKSLAPEMRPK